jgi:predicted Zn finger-like uncharacterized protein
MYLQCPKCFTVYAVNASMLRDGQGEVRCGACMTVFDALESLTDNIPNARSIAQDVSEAFDPEAPTIIKTGDQSDSGLDPVAQAPSDEDSGAVLLDTFKVEKPRPRVAATAQDVPESLREDWQRMHTARAARIRNISFGVLALLLLLGPAVQYMWFEPEDLLRRFPQARPGVEAFCKQTGCLLPSTRDPSKIQLLSRAVRAHPAYEGALLVSATFSNSAPWPQPFPSLKFSLYNVNGQTIASRIFSQVYSVE